MRRLHCPIYETRTLFGDISMNSYLMGSDASEIVYRSTKPGFAQAFNDGFSPDLTRPGCTIEDGTAPLGQVSGRFAQVVLRASLRRPGRTRRDEFAELYEPYLRHVSVIIPGVLLSARRTQFFIFDEAPDGVLIGNGYAQVRPDLYLAKFQPAGTSCGDASGSAPFPGREIVASQLRRRWWSMCNRRSIVPSRHRQALSGAAAFLAHSERCP